MLKWSLVALAAFFGSDVGAHAQVPSFYIFEATEIAGEAGGIVRSEPLSTAIPGGFGYRVLYRTSDGKGAPTIASALIFLPATASTGDAKVVAWAHRTTGIRPRCAPSLLQDPETGGDFVEVPGLKSFLADGNVVVAPDYIGLGAVKRGEEQTTIHPYLLSSAAAISIVDAIKAARHLPASVEPKTLTVGADVAIFGHSQGGHAALAAASLLAQNNAGLKLRGLAISAPPARLDKLLNLQRSLNGVILTAYVTRAFEAFNPGLKGGDILSPEFLSVRDQVSDLCIVDQDDRIAQNRTLVAAGLGPKRGSDTDGDHLAKSTLSTDWTKAFKDNELAILAPGMLKADYPVLISQGASDPLVPFRATRDDVVLPVCSFTQNKGAILYFPFGGHDSQFAAAKTEVVDFVRHSLAESKTVWPEQRPVPTSWDETAIAGFNLVLKCNDL